MFGHVGEEGLIVCGVLRLPGREALEALIDSGVESYVRQVKRLRVFDSEVQEKRLLRGYLTPRVFVCQNKRFLRVNKKKRFLRVNWLWGLMFRS